jgi:heme-degrading monooxygenase HmoA
MHIVVNKVAAPASQQQAVIEGFEKAAPAMKRFKGFLGLEIWIAEDNSILAVSRWESKAALEEYTSNPMFRSHHGGESSQQRSGSDQVTTYYAGHTIV